MVTLGLLARLEAKPGKEQELAEFLKSALPLVEEETGTINWYAFQINASTFGLFDSFENEDGRQAHIAGRVAATLFAKAPDLLAAAPVIEPVEIIAVK